MRRRVNEFKKEKGDRKVGDFLHGKSGLSCELFIRGVTFRAFFLEHEFEAPDVSILRAELNDYAEHWVSMTWHPVIEVRLHNDRHGYGRNDGESVSVELDRYYLSISPAGRSFKVEWDVDESHRKAEMDRYTDLTKDRNNESDKLLLIGLPLTAPIESRNGAYILPYTDATWITLKDIETGIIRMRNKLKEMVSTRQGVQQMLQIGAGAMPTPVQPVALEYGGVRKRTRSI